MLDKIEALAASVGPTRFGIATGATVGAFGVIGMTYVLMRMKGMPGGILDGIKIGAGCSFCRPFWTGVGIGIVGAIWITYALMRLGDRHGTDL